MNYIHKLAALQKKADDDSSKIKDTIDKAINETDSQKSRGSGFLANLALPVLGQIGHGSYMSLMPKMMWEDKGMFDKLVRLGKQKGTETLGLIGGVPNSYFDPSKNKVYIHQQHLNVPGMMAHELGHVRSMRGPKWDGKISQTGRLAQNIGNLSRRAHPVTSLLSTGIGSFAGNYLDDKDLALLGAVGSGVSVPMLSSEIKASTHGYNMLRKLGAGRFKALSAFIGVPTYLMSTAMPLTPWLARKIGITEKG